MTRTTLFADCTRDLIPKGHPALSIHSACLHYCSTSKGGYVRGRPAVHESQMMFIVVWSILNGIESFREVELACRMRVEMLAACDDFHPDHRTLWLFTKDNEDSISEALAAIIETCKEIGISKIGKTSLAKIRCSPRTWACKAVSQWRMARCKNMNRTIDESVFIESFRKHIPVK